MAFAVDFPSHKTGTFTDIFPLLRLEGLYA